jgi:hypothetical protein
MSQFEITSASLVNLKGGQANPEPARTGLLASFGALAQIREACVVVKLFRTVQ